MDREKDGREKERERDDLAEKPTSQKTLFIIQRLLCIRITDTLLKQLDRKKDGKEKERKRDDLAEKPTAQKTLHNTKTALYR